MKRTNVAELFFPAKKDISVRPNVRGPQRIKGPAHTQTQDGCSRLPAGNCSGCFSFDSPTGHLTVESFFLYFHYYLYHIYELIFKIYKLFNEK